MKLIILLMLVLVDLNDAHSCGPPTDISHGWHAGECYTYGCRITYRCDEGYELVARSERFCQEDGTWTPKELPSCVLITAVQCSPPENPRHGKATYTSSSYNSVVSYECKDGYTLVGETTRRCGADKKWSGTQPVCKAPCVVPHVSQGILIIISRNNTATPSTVVQHGELLAVNCNSQYEFLPNQSPVTCNNGRWTHNPKCESASLFLDQHPRLQWNRIRRSLAREKYKKLFIRHLLNNHQEKQYVHSHPGKINDVFQLKNKRNSDPFYSTLSRRIDEALARAKLMRVKRALKGGSSSRAFGTSHKSSSSSLSLRRTNKKTKNNIDDTRDEEDEENQITAKTKNRNKGPCSNLSNEPYVNIEIIKHGKDPNVTYGSGTVVKMACGVGYGLNMAENKTAKCVRGKWRPTKPVCQILPCIIPEILNGIFKLSKANLPENSTLDVDTPLNETAEVENGQIVDFGCEEGFEIQGPNRLRCWHGDWTASHMPECTPAPCHLPKITHGQYMLGYRAGLTIANGSIVTFQCDDDYNKIATEPLQCVLGKLNPSDPGCKPDSSVVGNVVEDPEFLGGSDIVRGGDITVVEYNSPTLKPCGPPAKVRGSLIYRNGEPLVDDENNFPEGTEVSFNCIESIMGEKTTWKIICEDGSWIGRSFNCDEDEPPAGPDIQNNSTCVFKNQEPNVISFYNDQQIREDVVHFPAGAILISRCEDIGKFVMTGPNKRRCMGGEWDGTKPACIGLNQEQDYSMEQPPTILFRHQLGPISQSNDGKLIVYPGTILHMECLWMRRFGNPKWTVSHDYRKYPEGWSIDPGRDSQLEYRLSIDHATKEDSGLFSCVTPARHTHSIEIEVKAVHCPAIPQRRGLTVNTQKTKMNTRLKFACVNGNSLIGAPEIVCLPSGNWSSPFPVCESIECGEVVGDLGPHLKVLVVSREVGGRAVFSCDSGFGLKGSQETVCQVSGEWATPYPVCEEVTCSPPTPPENGYIHGSGPYKAGDVIQFNCNPAFMMEGQPIMACQENSRWSGKMPKCFQACSYPGTTISGSMSSVKFYYKIGENITFTCDKGLQLKGASMLKCLRNGKWSNSIPTCVG